MTIYSLTFIFLFLPLTLLIYAISPQKLKSYILFLSSMVFYWLNSTTLLASVMANTTLDFFYGKFILHNPKISQKTSKILLNLMSLKSIVFVVSFSVYAELSSTFYLLGVTISAFTSLGYIVDLYHNECDKIDSFVDYGVFCFFFGKLYIGPLVSSKQFVPQLATLKCTVDKFIEGFVLFCHGFAKIVILESAATALGEKLNGIPLSQQSVLGVWVMVMCNLFAVYYRLSGYSDMARGIGAMFGINISPNFHYPFQSESVTEFFSNFNISANRFVRKYIYQSLGAEDNGGLSTCMNIMLITMIMGLWYGISLNLVLWGGFLGIFIIIETMWGEKYLHVIPSFLCRVGTFIIVTMSFTIYSTYSLEQATAYFKMMLGMNGTTLINPVSQYLINSHIVVLAVLLICATGLFSRASKSISAKVPTAWTVCSVFGNVILFTVTTSYLM